jgi:prefoldin subunit 5
MATPEEIQDEIRELNGEIRKLTAEIGVLESNQQSTTTDISPTANISEIIA